MNIPPIYLVEPYNAYAPKNRKKHPLEILEEQALLERIMAEQIALQKTQDTHQLSIFEAQSKTLPPNSPNISSPTVGNMAGGAGGIPVIDYFQPQAESIGFTANPTSGAGPLTVVFTNTTTTPQLDTYLWKFGDGETSTKINPTHLYQTGSPGVGALYKVELTASHAVTPTMMTSSIDYISASIPVVTALFTTSSMVGLVAPVTVSFNNGSTTTSQTPPTLTYLWTFGDGTTSPLANPPAHGYGTGSYTASLQATGSYDIASKYTQSFVVGPPVLTFTLAADSSSKYSPSNVTLTPTITHTGVGTLVGLWRRGETDNSDAEYTVPYVGNEILTSVYDTRSLSGISGSFTASLQLTESKYGVATKVTQSFYLTMPSIVMTLAVGSSSKSASSDVTLIPTITNNGAGTLSGLWRRGEYGEGGSGEYTVTYVGNEILVSTYDTRSATGQDGLFTASLQLTGSNYAVTTFVTKSFYISP